MTHRLMCIFAHPDDETLGMGGALAKFAADGVDVRIVTATRGERGWNSSAPNPGLEALGRIREQELLQALDALGVPRDHLTLLDYIDGDLDQAFAPTIIAQIERLIRQHRPQVIITFGPDGIYGHPDHIAIGQYALAAALQAAQPDLSPLGLAAHLVSKAYYMVDDPDSCAWIEAKWPGLGIDVDGVRRQMRCWPDWGVSARIDARAHTGAALRALRCHRSQVEPDPALAGITAADAQRLFGTAAFVRVYSRVNGGRQVEDDLFAGID